MNANTTTSQTQGNWNPAPKGVARDAVVLDVPSPSMEKLGAGLYQLLTLSSAGRKSMQGVHMAIRNCHFVTCSPQGSRIPGLPAWRDRQVSSQSLRQNLEKSSYEMCVPSAWVLRGKLGVGVSLPILWCCARHKVYGSKSMSHWFPPVSMEEVSHLLSVQESLNQLSDFSQRELIHV